MFSGSPKGLSNELSFRNLSQLDTDEESPTPHLPRARHASIDLPETDARGFRIAAPPPGIRLSPFELARHNLPPPTAERVLQQLPTFVRQAAMSRVSEEDVRALRRSMDKSNTSSSKSDPGTNANDLEKVVEEPAPRRSYEDGLRTKSVLDYLSMAEPMTRKPSDAQTVIPVVETHHTPPGSETGLRQPSINIYFGQHGQAQGHSVGTSSVPDTGAHPAGTSNLGAVSSGPLPVFGPPNRDVESQEVARAGRSASIAQIAVAVSSAIATIMGGIAVILASLNRSTLESEGKP